MVAINFAAAFAATASQNTANTGLPIHNTTGFKGVSIFRQTGQYRAQIRVDGRVRHLGLFNTPEEAAAVYRSAALKAHGEFARFE